MQGLHSFVLASGSRWSRWRSTALIGAGNSISLSSSRPLGGKDWEVEHGGGLLSIRRCGRPASGLLRLFGRSLEAVLGSLVAVSLLTHLMGVLLGTIAEGGCREGIPYGEPLKSTPTVALWSHHWRLVPRSHTLLGPSCLLALAHLFPALHWRSWEIGSFTTK